jgi:DNA polymerase III delta prime subunit
MERALVVGPPPSNETTTARALASRLRCTHTEHLSSALYATDSPHS